MKNWGIIGIGLIEAYHLPKYQGMKGLDLVWLTLVGQLNSINLGQALAVILTLAYEKENPNARMYQRRPHQQSLGIGKGRGWGTRPRNRDEALLYCTNHCSYSHGTAGYWISQNTQVIRVEIIAYIETKLLVRVSNLWIMVTKIGKALNEGKKMMVDDLKKVKNTKRALSQRGTQAHSRNRYHIRRPIR